MGLARKTSQLTTAIAIAALILGGAVAAPAHAEGSEAEPAPVQEPAPVEAPAPIFDADGEEPPRPMPITAPAPNGTWLWPGSTYTGNFADPQILPVAEPGGTVYYAFATNSGNRNLPVLRSTDLQSWTVTSYSSDMGWYDRGRPDDYDPFTDNAIPSEIRNFNYLVPNSTPALQRREAWLNADGLVSPRPSWARAMPRNPADSGDFGWRSQETWAPGIAYFNGKYHAYLSIRATGGGPDRFCIGLATSTKPAGPYRYVGGNSNVVCPKDRPNGVIDAEPFSYQGKWYLLWKSENAVGTRQGLHAQEIDTSTGRLKAGSRTVDLLQRDLSSSWEKHAIENPSMATIGGTTYLIYSSGEFWSGPNTTSGYSTSYAVCPKGPTAPCTRPAGDNRLLASAGSVQGPGGGSVFVDAKGTWRFVYHSYTLGGRWDLRQMRIANIYRWPSGAIAIADGARPRFADVPVHQQFHRHIMWLSERGITTGDKAGNFRPLGSTSRSDMAAFLYRYAGSPKYTPSGPEPFADVNKSTKFYKEIRWMHAKGLATGTKQATGKPLYKPKQAITREAMAAFFYRLSGTKGYTPRGKEPLVDVNRSSKFYREIRWMYDNGITTGITSGNQVRYNEYGTTKRDAFAAFLMRYDEKYR